MRLIKSSLLDSAFSPAPSSTRDLWVIAWMSFFWSVGTVMIASLLPTFLTEVLHVSHAGVGIFEGVAMAMMFASKIVAGVLSDLLRTRKPMIALGSAFTILVKLIFATASSFNLIFFAKCLDRLSKGIRSSPTDALIADFSTKETYGVSYGIRQTLYPLGVVFGSIVATWLMILTNNSYRMVFMAATLPSALALLILLVAIRQPKIKHELPSGGRPWRPADIQFLPRRFWLILAVTSVLMLARFSEAFLNLHAKAIGWPIALLPMLFVGYELVHALVAYPLGRMADRFDRRKLLGAGMVVLILANLILMAATNCWGALLGVMTVGLHMGMTQGLLSSMIAEEAPADLRGTAFALYYFCVGSSALLGNIMAGYLSEEFGSQGCFYGGALFTTLAAGVLCLLMRFANSVSSPLYEPTARA